MSTSEVWKPVPIEPYEHAYEVSDLGRVRNTRTGKVLTPMRTGTNRQSSQRSKVRFSTHPRFDFDVAHLVLCAFVGPRPEGYVAMHFNDDSTDNRICNVTWGTKSDNMVDMARKARGPSQKLGPAQVVEIVRRRSAGERGANLAREFGVSQQRVCDVYKGRTSLLSLHAIS